MSNVHHATHDRVKPTGVERGTWLQVRNGAVHILDYKPDARTNHSVAQLTVNTLAIFKHTGIRLFDIKCAWLNDEEHCEFFPRTLLARGTGKTKHGPSAAAA